MKKSYIIGVDGGNTKTDYFLFDTEGTYIGTIRSGTCSHERMTNGYEGSYTEMNARIQELLVAHNVDIEDVVIGVFGLAGLDTPVQKECLEEVIRRIGFKNFIADNDGYLGLKAGSSDGIGICSINGTGTVTAGIDAEGNRLQVGGIGYVSGDDGGGGFISRELFREIYTTLYRCGECTDMVDDVLALLNITDKKYFIHAVSEFMEQGKSQTEFVKLVLRYADKGDTVALKIVNKVAEELAKSTVGCIRNLEFKEEGNVTIVLGGSVWTKPKTTIMIDAYKMNIEKLTNLECSYVVLQVPPGIGAVLWALEVAKGEALDSNLRNKIIEEMKKFY
ncbi:MAG: N-acetylglucosamine kinase [Cellulosilyticaceae bacterium]